MNDKVWMKTRFLLKIFHGCQVSKKYFSISEFSNFGEILRLACPGIVEVENRVGLNYCSLFVCAVLINHCCIVQYHLVIMNMNF